MGLCAKPLEDGFVEPTEEKLNNLGPGCFVQVENHGSCCWVEIMAVSNTGYEAKAYPALSDGPNTEQLPCSDMLIQRNQITALGCDRYCFC